MHPRVCCVAGLGQLCGVLTAVVNHLSGELTCSLLHYVTKAFFFFFFCNSLGYQQGTLLVCKAIAKKKKKKPLVTV